MLIVCLYRLTSSRTFTDPLRKFLFCCCLLFFIASCSHKIFTVEGYVFETDGTPVEGAIVRLSADSIHTLSDSFGHFHLNHASRDKNRHVTAWKKGYFIGGTNLKTHSDNISVILRYHQKIDNQDYLWIDAKLDSAGLIHQASNKIGLFLANTGPFDLIFKGLDKKLETACIDCHGQEMYNEWFRGAHAAGNTNDRFMSMYNGTDLSGMKSPLTKYHYSRDYGTSPIPPKENNNYYGPGYKLDFPYSAGNCASCHLPAAAISNPYGTDPNEVIGINRYGSHCDFCHKIDQVILDPETQLPYNNRPGILSYSFLRPSANTQLFFGPYDDVDAGVDVHLPMISESKYCAGCHDANFWNTPIYKSYSEWYNSPYRDSSITCQDCHMKPNGTTSNFAMRRGGLERNPQTIATHGFPGAEDSILLRSAVTLKTEVSIEDSILIVKVLIVNDKTGHHVPTDSPLRHLILLIETKGTNSDTLNLIRGDRIPVWGGIGDVSEGNYAGFPGKVYAKVLQDIWTGHYPSGAYWLPTRIISDNRIAAFESDTSEYFFRLDEKCKSGNNPLKVDVKLIYRRAPIKLMVQKNWNTPDILMNQEIVFLEPETLNSDYFTKYIIP